MLVSGIIDLAAKRLDLDVDDYYTEVMISYINSAIVRINNGLIKANDPEVIKQLIIKEPIQKPADFFGFIPQKASYPINAIGNSIERAYGAPPSVVIKYSCTKPTMMGISDTIPLADYYIGQIVDYVCIHINNDFEANVTQDVGLATSDEDKMLMAKGG